MAHQHSEDRVSDSFIRQQESSNFCVKILKKIDIFSFIPVPKDDSVSTKQSLIGTAVFFVIFLTYIIYDFVTFVQSNPPIIQSYRTQLDGNNYVLPRFAYAYMNGSLTNETQTYQNFLNVSFSSIVKRQGSEDSRDAQWAFVKYDQATGQATNFSLIPWMGDATKQFYYVLRTPTEDLSTNGLLYSSDVTTYIRFKLNFCGPAVTNVTKNLTCMTDAQQADLAAHGRIFLFIENQPDTSSISLETASPNGNNYLLFNFFIIQGLYKRVNINFQVIKDEILPDYLLRWSTERTQRLQIESVFQEVSNSSYGNQNLDAIAFNMQLSPLMINNRISFTTLIDHISLWGAFWGVLFAIFALFFLSYNRRKFYRKNPEWSKFKKLGSSINHSDEDQRHI